MIAGALQQLDNTLNTLRGEDLARHELAFLLTVRDRIDHLAATNVGRLHVTGDARLDGAASTSAWLRHHAHTSEGDAQRLIRVGTALRKLPHLDQAIGNGLMTMAQADQLVRGVGPRLDAFATDETGEADVVDAVIGLSAKDAGTVASHWAARHDALHHPRPEPAPPTVFDDDDPFAPSPAPDTHESGCSCGVPKPADPSTVYLSQLIDRFILDADLTPADGETIRLAADLFGPPHDVTMMPAQRRAHGLVAACRFALDHRDTDRSPRHRPHLLIHTTTDLTVGTTPDGMVLTPGQLAVAACDAVISRLVTDRAGHVLDYGRRTRIIPTPLRDVVVARDRHCRFPSCNRNAAHCHTHHVTPWSQGGPTSLTNLVLLCAFHHAVVHTTGWHAKLHPDGELRVQSPTGLLMSTRPPPR
jgi:hypothetical protein